MSGNRGLRRCDPKDTDPAPLGWRNGSGLGRRLGRPLPRAHWQSPTRPEPDSRYLRSGALHPPPSQTNPGLAGIDHHLDPAAGVFGRALPAWLAWPTVVFGPDRTTACGSRYARIAAALWLQVGDLQPCPDFVSCFQAATGRSSAEFPGEAVSDRGSGVRSRGGTRDIAGPEPHPSY